MQSYRSLRCIFTEMRINFQNGSQHRVWELFYEIRH